MRRLGVLLLIGLATSCDYSAKQREAWKVVLRFYVAVSTCNAEEFPQYVAERAFRNLPLSALQERVRSTCLQRGAADDLRKVGSSQGESDSPKTRGRLYCVSYRMRIRYSKLGEANESIQVCSDEGKPGAPYRVEFYDTTADVTIPGG